MRKQLLFILLLVMASCGNRQAMDEKPVITVSIAPYKYIVEAIAGDEYDVNVMVPAGASPHSYEPYPDQIKKLEKSTAYIANGYLDFETTWLDRFSKVNPQMKILMTCVGIELIESSHSHDGNDHEAEEEHHGSDPHFWLSPNSGMQIAASVKDFLCMLDPANVGKFEKNYYHFVGKIRNVNTLADSLFSRVDNKSFVIYHPNLAYLAKDYGLAEYAIEKDGKEPSPSYLKELVDFAKEARINTIFIQKEFDKRYAQTIADDINAEVVVIDPLAEDWISSMEMIITKLYDSFNR